MWVVGQVREIVDVLELEKPKKSLCIYVEIYAGIYIEIGVYIYKITIGYE